MKILWLLIFSIILWSCENGQVSIDHLDLEKKLNGKWTAKAFDGELHEEWHLNKQGWMEQEGFYIEDKDTSYSAVTTIQKISGELILISVIKDSNPKVFKSTGQTDKQITFENDDYKNPVKVHYEFLGDQKYRRTISGYEGDSLVSYQFNFKKVN